MRNVQIHSFLFLKGLSFGILSPQPHEMSSPPTYHDLSLNSLTEKPHYQKFLKQPLKASESIAHRNVTKEIRSEFEKNRNKRIPFNTRLKAAKDKLIIQRVVASNRLSFKFYKPGSDMRMEGDGSENPENFCEDQSNTSLKSDSKPMKERLPVMICKDLNCKNPHCLETESQPEEVHHLNICSDLSNNLVDFLENAEELRRFIRETSFDSLASDLSFGINLGFDEEEHIEPVMDLHSFGDGSMHPIACIEEEGLGGFTQKGASNEHYLWKLTDISYETESLSDSENPQQLLAIPYAEHSTISSGKSEAGDDVSSYAGSVLDNLEWDDDCYFGYDTLAILDDDQFEQNTLHQPWLPDTCQELDLETELSDSKKDSIRSSRSSSVRLPRVRRSPPSGCASVERESLSRQSRSSTTSENITITCPTPNI